jgi:hypothetical protein
MLRVLLQTQGGLNYYSLREITPCFYLSRKHVALYQSFHEPILRRKARLEKYRAVQMQEVEKRLGMIQ